MDHDKIWKRLDYWLKNAQAVPITDEWKALHISDPHIEDRGEADDFQKNYLLFMNTIRDYLAGQYKICIQGDWQDRWEQSDEAKILSAYPDLFALIESEREKGNIFQIRGNHDEVLPFQQAVKFVHQGTGKTILCVHGHQGDWCNDQDSWIGRSFVRYIWAPAQRLLGLPDPTTATPDNLKKHNLTRDAFHTWANQEREIDLEVVWGHTHAYGDVGRSHNCGSWVGPGGEGVVVEQGGLQITAKRFS